MVTLTDQASVRDIAQAFAPNHSSKQLLTLELLPPQGGGPTVLLPPQALPAKMNLASGLNIRVREGATSTSPAVLPAWATVNRVPPISRMFHPHAPPSRPIETTDPPVIMFQEPPAQQRIPVTALLLPLIAGVALFILTNSRVALVMALLTPLVLLVHAMWGRLAKKRFRGRELVRLKHQLDNVAQQAEQRRRELVDRLDIQYPTTRDLCSLADTSPQHLWWSKVHPEQGVTIRLGTCNSVLPSVTEWVQSVALQGDGQAERDHVTFVHETLRSLPSSSHTPQLLALQPGMRIGVVGQRAGLIAILTELTLQLAVRCSPAELRIRGDHRTELTAINRILAWLPHTHEQGLTRFAPHLDVVLTSGETLTDATEMTMRHANAVIIIVEEDPENLPPDCDVILIAEPGGGYRIRQATDSTAEWGETEFTLLVLDPSVSEEIAMRLAGVLPRAQSPMRNRIQHPAADIERHQGQNLPPSVTLPEPEVTSWQTPATGADRGLSATVGMTSEGPFTIDLRAQGPHALVGGTTGSGKSEFLQTWVLSLAASHPPNRVNFLFIDYKGGAAFAECTRLPHSVGLVTDLTPHLAQRALVSLRAELTAREELLLRKRVKRIEDLERQGDPDTPPALVIVIDEFAALSAEVPEFVDGVIDIAQRGRSLGFHLILATQRPAGVVTSNLRANTNLRIALRTADESDSVDVIGKNWAAHFPQDCPGRAAMVVGSGMPTLFQAAYVGGPPEREHTRAVTVIDLHTGPRASGPYRSQTGASQEADESVRSVQERIVEMLLERAQAEGTHLSRRPWVEPLAPVYDLTKLRQRSDTELLLGVADRPETQYQGTCYFEPERDGHVAVIGAPGSGKSSTLRTLAVAAGITPRGGPVHVYGIDCGSGGLASIEGFPQVAAIVRGDSVEGVRRTLQHLGRMLDERDCLFQSAGVETLGDYQGRDRQHRAQQQLLPRILLLIDDLATFRAEWEHLPGMVYETFMRILVRGRNAGIHVALTANRGQELPAALLAHIGCRVVLRQSDGDAYTMLGVPRGILTDEAPPGRGVIDGAEVQVAVIGGTPLLHGQLEAIADLTRVIEERHPAPAPQLRVMPEVLTDADVPGSVAGRPVLGVSDDTLEPVTFQPAGVIRVAAEDNTTLAGAVSGILRSLSRAEISGQRLLMDVDSRSPFTGLLSTQNDVLFDRLLTTQSEVTETLETLIDETDQGVSCVVLFGIQRLAGTDIEEALRNLIGTRFTERLPSGMLFLVAATTKEWGGHFGLVGSLKEIARGLIVQPGPHDGEQVFGLRLPPPALGSYPQGRAVAVSGLSSQEVQLVVGEGAMTGADPLDWVL